MKLSVRIARCFLLLALALPCAAFVAAQTPVAFVNSGCCGPVTAKGQRLIEVIDGMDVEHNWQSNWHVDWKTGRSERFEGDTGAHTHCSAFAAAVGLRLGVYMLRPPDHPQALLASAQGRWFDGDDARKQGWKPVASPRDAQSLANRGQLVVIVFVNPKPDVPGHVVIVRPAEKTDAELARNGPETAQAGKHNFSRGSARASFSSHEDAWPNQVRMFSHPIDFDAAAAPAN